MTTRSNPKAAARFIAGCSLVLLIEASGAAFAHGSGHNHATQQTTYVRDHRQPADTSWFCPSRQCYGSPKGTGRDHRTYSGGAQGSGGMGQGRHHLN